MGKTAEELRLEIEQSRSNLTSDLDAIGDRVSPNRIVERRTEAARSRIRTMKESVMGTAETVSDRALDLRDQAGDTAGDLRSSVSEAAHDAAGRAGERVHHGAERVGEVPDMVRHETQGNPLAAGLVAFGLGLLAATVLPETCRERKMAATIQPKLETAARSAADAGREMVDEMRPSVETSTGHLTDQVHRAADHLTDQARDAAQSVAGTARQGAEHVTDTARP